MSEIIEGQAITDIHTIGSMYANGHLIVLVNGSSKYRIHVSEILKMVNEFRFTTEQKRKYIHLHVLQEE